MLFVVQYSFHFSVGCKVRLGTIYEQSWNPKKETNIPIALFLLHFDFIEFGFEAFMDFFNLLSVFLQIRLQGHLHFHTAVFGNLKKIYLEHY